VSIDVVVMHHNGIPGKQNVEFKIPATKAREKRDLPEVVNRWHGLHDVNPKLQIL
jgi:hypothetical protein